MVVPATCAPGIAAGMAALQLFYNPSSGLWDTTNWWNAANALGTTIEYSRLTDSLTYRGTIFNTFYQKPRYKNFINPWFRDDDGWWILTWINAYDLTENPRYLEQAKFIFRDMSSAWEDKVCGGGLYWHKRELNYKNAITNSLFLASAAKLALREPDNPQYLEWANRIWTWFKASGMINSEQLVNDGLDSNCRNNGKRVWSYNQGVLMGGLVDLYRSTNDQTVLDQAVAIADASIVKLAPNGILQDPCEPKGDCGNDGPQFKGVFMRNLAALYKVVPKPSYREFIVRNANSIWANRNNANHFGLTWDATVDQVDATRQSSAMDAINAAISLGTNVTYQAEESRFSFLTKGSDRDNFNGSGYLSNWDSDNAWIRFNVNVACSGRYNLAFRYASTGDATRYVHVNGRKLVDNQLFPNTNNQWQQLQVEQVWLNAGDNQVSVIFNQAKGSQNDLALDALTVAPFRRFK
jgi:hypothetical protein